MKNNILVLVFFIASYSFSQSINDYKAVIIPVKYDFQKSENQFRLQTMTKFNLEKAGMAGFYGNDIILAEYPDRCSLLYIDVIKDSGFLTTKVYITFKNCYGNIVYQSAVGTSREKEFEKAYFDALNDAFVSVYELEYKYNGNTNFSPNSGVVSQAVTKSTTVASSVQAVSAVVEPVTSVSTTKIEGEVIKIAEDKSVNVLYAQPTSYGYQLIDSEPKVIMKVYRTSNPASYMATKDSVQGVLVLKDNIWFFEYYDNDKLISEKINVKF